MPKRVDHDQQRVAILEAAGEVFAQRGLQGTGLSHVARALGISRPALYTYYADKAALLEDLAGDLLERERTLFEAALMRPGPPVARIVALSDALAAWLTQESRAGALILQIAVTRPEDLREVIQSLCGTLAKTIAEGQDDATISAGGSADGLARALIGLWDGLMLQYCLGFPALAPLELRVLTLRVLGADGALGIATTQ